MKGCAAASQGRSPVSCTSASSSVAGSAASGLRRISARSGGELSGLESSMVLDPFFPRMPLCPDGAQTPSVPGGLTARELGPQMADHERDRSSELDRLADGRRAVGANTGGAVV